MGVKDRERKIVWGGGGEIAWAERVCVRERESDVDRKLERKGKRMI